METLRPSPHTKVGKLFTRRVTFEKILKPRVAQIGRAQKTVYTPSDVVFSIESQRRTKNKRSLT